MVSDLEVSQLDPEPRFPPMSAAGRGRAWYRGDCHVHSRHSQGGELTAAELAAEARLASLDFIAITEHNRADTYGEWGPHAGDDLLVILGQEVTTYTGHWLALGIAPETVVESRYGVRDRAIDRHLQSVGESGGLCVAAHPHAPYPSGVLMYPFEAFDAVEVWNGRWASDLPWNADNQAALAEWGRSLAVGDGRWLPAMGNSDVHLPGQLGEPQTVVLAEELSTNAILAGLRAGRSWIAESAAVELECTVTAGESRAGIGERLAAGGRSAVVSLAVAGVPGGTVTFCTDRGKVHYKTLPDAGKGSLEWRTSAEESMFVRVEIRHQEGSMAALTNPIFLV